MIFMLTHAAVTAHMSGFVLMVYGNSNLYLFTVIVLNVKQLDCA